MFGYTEFRTAGDLDPYNAFSIRLTNLRPDQQQVEIQVFADIFPTGSPNDIEIYLDAAVEDTDSSGAASFADAMAFSGAFNQMQFALVPFVQNDSFSLNSGGASTVLDLIGPGPTLTDFGVSTVDQLFMSSIGVLSPGDSIVLNGFVCIYEDGGSCPERPDLSFAAVPLPAASWLLLGPLCCLLRRLRTERLCVTPAK